MSLIVALQMDPIDSIDINGDSSFALALEAQRRGYELIHYLPKNLTFKDQVITAKAQGLSVQRVTGNHFSLEEFSIINLKSEVDVILMRQDPPFDMSYITATHILEHIHPETLVVNDPINVRNAPEKLFVTHFKDIMPATLITNDRQEVDEFRKEYKDIIVKPLYGNGGAGVFHIKPNDENLSSLLECYHNYALNFQSYFYLTL